MTLYLVRHPAPAVAPGVCYGQLDLPTLEPPEDCARAWNPVLPPADRCRIWSSPLRRALLPARAWASSSAVTVDPALQELNFGLWEGQNWEAIPRSQTLPWMSDFVETAPPGGESLRQLAHRVSAWFAQVRQQTASDDRPIVVFTHKGVIQTLICLRDGKPLAEAVHFPVEYSEVVPY
jgi:alpha-ribazole phosphatase